MTRTGGLRCKYRYLFSAVAWFDGVECAKGGIPPFCFLCPSGDPGRRDLDVLGAELGLYGLGGGGKNCGFCFIVPYSEIYMLKLGYEI